MNYEDNLSRIATLFLKGEKKEAYKLFIAFYEWCRDYDEHKEEKLRLALAEMFPEESSLLYIFALFMLGLTEKVKSLLPSYLAKFDISQIDIMLCFLPHVSKTSAVTYFSLNCLLQRTLEFDNIHVISTPILVNYTIETNRFDEFTLLLRYGARLDVKDSEGYTPNL